MRPERARRLGGLLCIAWLLAACAPPVEGVDPAVFAGDGPLGWLTRMVSPGSYWRDLEVRLEKEREALRNDFRAASKRYREEGRRQRRALDLLTRRHAEAETAEVAPRVAAPPAGDGAGAPGGEAEAMRRVEAAMARAQEKRALIQAMREAVEPMRREADRLKEAIRNQDRLLAQVREVRARTPL